MTVLSQRLRQKREAAGLSQEDLAEAIGLRQTSIAKLESGASRTCRKIFELAAALGVTPEWLLGKSDVEQPSPSPAGVPSAIELGTDPQGRATRMIARRTEMAMSQADLARAARCSQQLIGALEVGRIKWSRKIPDIARALDVDLGWLETGRQESPPLVSLPLTDREKDLIRRFRDAPEDQRVEIEKCFGITTPPESPPAIAVPAPSAPRQD